MLTAYYGLQKVDILQFTSSLAQIYSEKGPFWIKRNQLSIRPSKIRVIAGSIVTTPIFASKYAPYEGNESTFDAPVDFSKDGMDELLSQASSNWILTVSASPDSVETTQRELSDAGLENAPDYVKTVAESTHGAKYDLLIPDPNIPDIDLKTGIYFNPIRLFSGYYQIGRKEFALKVLPHVRVLESGEGI